MIASSRFVAQYLMTALWSSTDNSRGDGGDPLDRNYGPDDVAPETLKAMHADCDAFVTANEADLADIDDEQAGHDFWLTRNRYGAGFWDRGLVAAGERLTKAAHAFGEVSLYVGDDGRVYSL